MCNKGHSPKIETRNQGFKMKLRTPIACVVVMCLPFAHLPKQPPAKLDIGCRTKNYTNKQICCGEARTCRPRSSIESGASYCVFLLHLHTAALCMQGSSCPVCCTSLVNSYNYPRRVRPRDWRRRAMQAALSTGTHFRSASSYVSHATLLLQHSEMDFPGFRRVLF